MSTTCAVLEAVGTSEASTVTDVCAAPVHDEAAVVLLVAPAERPARPTVAPTERTGRQAGSPVAPTRGVRVLLLAFCLLTAAAVVSLVLLADRTDETFAWTIRPAVSAGFLGSGYLAGLVLSVLAVRSGDWREVRIPYLTVLVFTWVTAAATFFHLHRLHVVVPGAGPVAEAAAWLWLAVYVVVPVGMAVLLPRQPRLAGPAADGPRARLPRGLSAALVAEGTVMAAVAVRLVARCLGSHGTPSTPSMPSTHDHAGHVTAPALLPASVEPLWPWPVTPLGCGVVAAWLLAFAVAVVLVVADGDLGRLRTATWAYTVFGVAQLVNVVRFHDDVDWARPGAWVLIVVAVAVTATGGVGVVLSRRARLGRPGRAA